MGQIMRMYLKVEIAYSKYRYFDFHTSTGVPKNSFLKLEVFTLCTYTLFNWAYYFPLFEIIWYIYWDIAKYFHGLASHLNDVGHRPRVSFLEAPQGGTIYNRASNTFLYFSDI